MGWVRTLLLGDIGNRLDIADAESNIGTLRSSLRKARRSAKSLEKRVDALETENEQLELFVTVLLQRLESKGILSNDDVQRMANIVDPPEDTD